MSKSLSLISALLCTFIWGTTFIAQDTGMDKIGPLTFNGARFLIGFFSIIPLALIFENSKIIKQINNNRIEFFKLLFWIGLFLFLGTFVQQAALLYTDIANAAFFTVFYVPMVPIILYVFYKKKIKEIAKELKNISELSRNLKIDKKEFFGGSITITSLGGIGGTYFTPIINYPEVAILGVGRSYKKQIFIKDKFLVRTVLPISLSYDHRIIDGAEAARFCNSLKDNLGKNFAYNLAF